MTGYARDTGKSVEILDKDGQPNLCPSIQNYPLGKVVEDLMINPLHRLKPIHFDKKTKGKKSFFLRCIQKSNVIKKKNLGFSIWIYVFGFS